MKRIMALLLATAVLFGACNTTQSNGMKAPRKAHYKTKEGKKKQKFYNDRYKN